MRGQADLSQDVNASAALTVDYLYDPAGLEDPHADYAGESMPHRVQHNAQAGAGLPALRHIVLAYQHQIRVEHYRRTDEGWSWETLTQLDDILRFEAVGFQIDLERVYFGFELTSGHRLSR